MDTFRLMIYGWTLHRWMMDRQTDLRIMITALFLTQNLLNLL